MQPDAIQSVVVAIVLGALIAAWAFQHFHEFHRPEDIRFSVPRQRYLVALGVHVSAILAIYAILILAIYGTIMLARGAIPPLSCYGPNAPNVSKEFCEELKTLKPDALVWSVLASVFFVRIMMPNIPMVRHLIDRLRRVTHDVALFPFARQSLVAALSTSRFTTRNGSDAELREELTRYGMASESMSFLSPSAKLSLLEACSVRRRLIELSDQSQAFREAHWKLVSFVNETLFAAEPRAAEDGGLPNSWTFQRFQRARAATFAQLETDFRRLIRRSAGALLLLEKINEQVKDETLCLAVSNFVAEESDDVLTRYRRLIAEAALSCVLHRAERAQFLKSFGYEAIVPPAVPLRPWVIVFVLDFLLFLIPSVLMRLDETLNVPSAPLALFACVHAISQTVAITWAIYPKIGSNFARPSLYSLPWQSYVVFGLGSYVTGAMILFIFRIAIPLPFPIVLPTLLSSLSFLLMTVGVSALIDLRLHSRSLDFEQGRVQDGVVIGLLMLAGTLTFQAVMFLVAPRLGLVDPKSIPPLFIPASFLVLSGGLGFVMGYNVPAAAAAYLQRASLRAPDQRDHSRLGDPLRHSNAGWQPASSTRSSLQA